MESASRASHGFDTTQEYAVYGYTRECQALMPYVIIPPEIIAVCLLFYQTERLKEDTNGNIKVKSSKLFTNDIATGKFTSAYDNEISSNGYVYGAFKINSKLNLNKIEWKLRLLKPCPMRIGITADRHNVDTVLNVNGYHRFHTLSYLGILASHRKQYNILSGSLFGYMFAKHDIVTVSLDMKTEMIQFVVDDENGKGKIDAFNTLNNIHNPEIITKCCKVNVHDEYKLVIYMCGTWNDDSTDGMIQLIEFQTY
eukprot:354613_1